MKLKYIFIAFSLFAFLSCKVEKSEYKNISTKELKVLIEKDKNIQLLDVRTPKECSKGTIKNALEVDVTNSNFENKVEEVLDKNKPVYVYCRSGGRSKIASKMLAEKGYTTYNIVGGYMDWIKEK